MATTRVGAWRATCRRCWRGGCRVAAQACQAGIPGTAVDARKAPASGGSSASGVSCSPAGGGGDSTAGWDVDARGEGCSHLSGGADDRDAVDATAAAASNDGPVAAAADGRSLFPGTLGPP